MTSLPRSAGALARPVVRPAIRPSRPDPAQAAAGPAVPRVRRLPRDRRRDRDRAGHARLGPRVDVGAEPGRRHRHAGGPRLRRRPAEPRRPDGDVDQPPTGSGARSRPQHRSSRRAGSSGRRSGAPTGRSSRATPRSPGCTAPNSADWQTALAGQPAVSLVRPRPRARPARATSAPDRSSASTSRSSRTAASSGWSGCGATRPRSSIAIDAARRDVWWSP